MPKCLHRPQQWHLLGKHKAALQGRTMGIYRGRKWEDRESDWGVSVVTELKGKARPGTWQDTRLFPWQKRCGNEETERKGAVACWMRGVCTASQAELSLASPTVGIATAFPNISILLLTLLKPTLKMSYDVFQMLFLTCSLCVNLCVCPAFASANQN